MSTKDLKILYEDNHVIVVIKPANILSQSDITGDIDMLSLVKTYVKEKYQKPGEAYIGLVHRLDRPTTGIMVFAKTSKAAARLSKQIQNSLFSKEYMAVIQGILPKKEGTFIDYLEKHQTHSVISNQEHGKYAELAYRVEKEDISSGCSLVHIELKTGRNHQIRLQFSSRGYPLVGDQKYGYQDKKQLLLVAYRLSFIHPTTKEKMVFTFPDLPKLPGFSRFFC